MVRRTVSYARQRFRELFFSVRSTIASAAGPHSNATSSQAMQLVAPHSDSSTLLFHIVHEITGGCHERATAENQSVETTRLFYLFCVFVPGYEYAWPSKQSLVPLKRVREEGMNADTHHNHHAW